MTACLVEHLYKPSSHFHAMAIGEMGRRASTRRSSLTALAICTRAAPVRRGSLEPVLSCEEISDLDEQSSAKDCRSASADMIMNIPTPWEEGLELHLEEPFLGNGAFAKIWRVTERATGEERAMKVICRSSYTRRGIERQLDAEINAMRRCAGTSQHILRLFDVIEEKDHAYLLVELCAGDLLNYTSVQPRSRLPEAEAAVWSRQMYLGLGQLHCLGIFHRDIKPENLLYTVDRTLKIADFGWCAHVRHNPCCLAGTFLYMAPEILSGSPQTEAVDVWSGALTMLQLMTAKQLLTTYLGPGATTFSLSDPQQATMIKTCWLIAEIHERCPLSDDSRPSFLSPECWDLHRKGLMPDPKKRLIVSEALLHMWLSRKEEADPLPSPTCAGNVVLRTRTPTPEEIGVSEKLHRKRPPFPESGGNPAMKPCKKREPTPENRTGDVVKHCRKREPTPESERWAGSLDSRKREATPEGHASALEKPWRKHRQPTPESRAGSLDKPWRKREATPESGSPGCKTARCTSSSPPLTRGQRHSPGRASASQMDGAEKPHASAPAGTRAPASRGRSPAQPQVGVTRSRGTGSQERVQSSPPGTKRHPSRAWQTGGPSNTSTARRDDTQRLSRDTEQQRRSPRSGQNAEVKAVCQTKCAPDDTSLLRKRGLPCAGGKGGSLRGAGAFSKMTLDGGGGSLGVAVGHARDSLSRTTPPENVNDLLRACHRCPDHENRAPQAHHNVIKPRASPTVAEGLLRSPRTTARTRATTVLGEIHPSTARQSQRAPPSPMQQFRFSPPPTPKFDNFRSPLQERRSVVYAS